MLDFQRFPNKKNSKINIILVFLSGMDAAERRRQQIQESKFLGGDMEHTHLVKGLDYALLQKVSMTDMYSKILLYNSMHSTLHHFIGTQNEVRFGKAI
jgi:hypothetical protein